MNGDQITIITISAMILFAGIVIAKHLITISSNERILTHTNHNNKNTLSAIVSLSEKETERVKNSINS